MLPTDDLPHTTNPDADSHDLGDSGITERDGMTGFMNGSTPAHIVGEFHLTSEQGLFEIVPGQRPLLPSRLSSDVTNKSLNVGSSATGRQQGEPSKIGMLV
ncbi:hypothetical protein [Rhizobium anhuiense]|uniref:hypothetical protein n=1 Tax=Rhizobium anhuiense TaxID=1184720 RepID=UPI0007B52D6F|nr:hypothetical protein [Rhizobium anhuiense]KZS56948.1 hypothetical protein AS890_06945 [Rhizobium anhuiense bv. trifolii]